MSTWAKLAASSPEGAEPVTTADKSTAEPSTSTTTSTPPAPAQRRQSTSKAKANGPSKASTSDNWRASARANTETPAPAARSSDHQRNSGASNKAQKADTTDEDGWEKVTKKEKATPASAPQPQARGKKQGKEGGNGAKKGGDGRRGGNASGGHESSGTEEKGKGGAASKGGVNGAHKEAAAAPKKDPLTAVRPSLKPTHSWADDDGSGRLPSPNFGAVPSPAVKVTVPDDAAVENLALPPSAADSRTESPTPNQSASTPAVEVTPSDNDSNPPAEAAKPAPAAPKVNVWSVRKEQLAQAAPANVSSEEKTQQESAPTTSAPIPVVKEKKEEAPKSSKKDEARRSQTKKATTTANEAPAAKAKFSTAGARQGGSSAGWSSTNVKQKGPVVVAGEDATSWPAPVEAVKELDEAAKAKQDQEGKPKAAKTSGSQKKKKGEKWVPLKTEITVAPAGSKSRGKGAKGGGEGQKAGAAEKKGASATQSDSQTKGKSTAGPSQHPLPAKPTAAVPTAQASPSKQSASATTNASGAPAPSAQSSLDSAPASPSGPNSSQPSAASDAAGTTPATTAASSANGGDGASSIPAQGQPAALAGQGAHAQQAGFAARGRGRGGVPTRGTRGRGGPPVNTPNRFFHQQQHAAMQAVGYVPVPIDLDPTGTGVLDAYGNPVPVPVINPAAGPVQIDPRMLDPTRYWLLGQIEWWFSVDNLCRDLFLRQSMDTAGWIPISIIASFNRIKNLTNDIKIVVECMRMTPLLEVSPKDRFVRLAQTWPQWVLPNAQTNEDVKKDFEEASNPAASAEPKEQEAKVSEPSAAEQDAPTAPAADVAPQTQSSTSVAAPAPQSNGDATEAAEPAPQVNETGAEQQSESSVKASPPPRRGSPPAAPHAISPKASLAQPVLDVAVSAVVTVSAPPKSSA